MLDIDVAIKHCLDIADGQDKCAEISVSEHAKERISQCAADHRQLAEWLTELKELRSKMDACNILAVDAFAVENLCKKLREAKSIIRVCNRVLGYLLECEIESTSTRHEVETLLKNITVFLSGGGENE